MIVQLFALGLGTMQTATPMRVEARWDGTTCATLADGVPIAAEALGDTARAWARHGRSVTLVSGADIPYRCIGATLYALQLAGYRATSDIGGAPDFSMTLTPRVRFAISAGQCGYRVNDVPVSAGELSSMMADWKRADIEVAFEVDPQADYGCVEAGLAMVKKAGVAKLGFVGNEAVAPEGDEQ